MSQKDKVVFQTRSRTVTLPTYNQEEYTDSEDEDYEPSSGSEEEEEELVGRKRSTRGATAAGTKKQKVIDLEAEVIDLDDEDNHAEKEKKDNVNKIWEDMNKDSSNSSVKDIIEVNSNNSSNNNSSNNENKSDQTNKDESIDEKINSTLENQENSNNENNNVDNNNNKNNNNNNNSDSNNNSSTDNKNSNKSNEVNENNSTTTIAQKETSSSPPPSKQQPPQQETEIVEYAGEKIEVKKPLQPKPMPGKKKAGLDSLLSNLSKPKKINTLEKSRLDWDKFKSQDMNENEKHTLEQQKKDGYLEKEAFLQRAGENQHQEKLNLLKKLNK